MAIETPQNFIMTRKIIELQTIMIETGALKSTGTTGMGLGMTIEIPEMDTEDTSRKILERVLPIRINSGGETRIAAVSRTSIQIRASSGIEMSLISMLKSATSTEEIV